MSRTSLNTSGTLFLTASDINFVRSVREFISSEVQRCPDDETRYSVYSTAFEKVIDYATAYKTILTAIKKEYDHCISAVKTNDSQARFAHGKLKAKVAEPTSLKYHQMRSAQLQERIAVIQRNTAEFQAELKRLQVCGNNQEHSHLQGTLEDQDPMGPLPGLTFNESLNIEALDKHLRFLEQKRADLLTKKGSQYVPMQVKDELDIETHAAFHQRDELALEKEKQQRRYKQLTYLNGAINSWEKSTSCPSLLEFLSSELKYVSEMKVFETDGFGINSDMLEEDDPSKIRKSELLVDYIKRFSELFDAGEYEAAAYHAVKSPDGILRNMETINRFKSVTRYEGQLPPVLMFFHALMISAQPGDLPGEMLSLEGVRCALQHGHIQLVTFWVTQHRLTYTEELADVLCSHGDKDPHVADTCLALAHTVYTACGMLRKAALSMCRRGLTSSTVEFIYNSRNFTAEDCMFVLRECPSLSLLQDFTQPYGGKPALLSESPKVPILFPPKMTLKTKLICDERKEEEWR